MFTFQTISQPRGCITQYKKDMVVVFYLSGIISVYTFVDADVTWEVSFCLAQSFNLQVEK